MQTNASRRKLPETPTAASTSPSPVATEVTEALQSHPNSGHSPAIQLQNMLLDRFSIIEDTALKVDKYDVRIRLACIVGISCAGWAIIGLAAKGLFTLIAG